MKFLFFKNYLNKFDYKYYKKDVNVISFGAGGSINSVIKSKDFKLIELKERNTYIETIYVLFLRTMCVGSIKQRFIGVILFPFFILALPFFIILNLFISNNQATTGYFYIFKRK